MNKVIAGKIAEDELQAYMKKEPEIIKSLLVESDHKFLVKNGIEYQLRVSAFYDDKRYRDKGKIRVCITVDDQKFWSTLLPLSKSDYYYLNG